MRADAMLQLLFARRFLEISRRTADVVYIAFKIRIAYQQLRLAHERVLAARLYAPALMERKRTETTAAETAAR